jgi:hypothetical protein
MFAGMFKFLDEYYESLRKPEDDQQGAANSSGPGTPGRDKRDKR